jgi:hypothetical protein
MKRVCIVGISGKLGRYMLRHALAAGYEVRGVCRPESVGKLAEYADRITLFPGRTDDRAVMAQALEGCEGVLCVLAPWGMTGYSTNTAQAVLDFTPKDARLVFSSGWHISLDGKDRYSLKLRAIVALFGPIARLLRIADLDDQVRACDTIFASGRRWTLVRGSDLEEGDSEGLPLWSEHVGDPVLALNRTRRIDFALFMVSALTDDSLIGRAPAIVSRRAGAQSAGNRA